jgi:hypothetical protein
VVSEGEVSVIGIERGGTGFIPVAGSTFQQGDVTHFLVTAGAQDRLHVLLEPVSEDV